MLRFEEYYYLHEKISDVLRRAFTSNIFKKQVVGVNVDKLKQVSRVGEKTFSRVSDALKNSLKSTAKTKESIKKRKGRTRLKPSQLHKILRTDLGKIYVKNVFVGEMDDKGDNLGDFNTIHAITVYELNNGGKIILFTTENDKGEIKRFIGINKTKTNEFFKEKVGSTFQQLAADAQKSIKSEFPVKATSINVTDPFYDFLKSEPKTTKTSPTKYTKKSVVQPDDTGEIQNELGLLDITIDEKDTLERAWGDGKSGGILKGGTYPLKGAFHRTKFYNNIGKGYKYYDDTNKHTIYLIDLGDNENGLIVFDGKSSLTWANGLDMLDYWRTGHNENRPKIQWIKGDINNLPN